MFQKDEGIVINISIYRNTSQLVKMFLKNNGYVLGYAKGIYKMKKYNFDGPFIPFSTYETEFHGSAIQNDIVILTSSKCLTKLDYFHPFSMNYNINKIISKINFLKGIQKFIEEFFIAGYKDENIYNYLVKFTNFMNKADNLTFLHYAYFIVNILKLMGLLNTLTLNKIKISKRMRSFMKFLLTANLMKEVNTSINSSLRKEFLFSIKNNFYQYYNSIVRGRIR